MPCQLPAPFEKNPLRINQAVRDLASGRSNAHGLFTLASDGVATQTTVQAPGCGINAHVDIAPRNAAAKTEWLNSACFVSSTAQGSFIVKHTASAAVRTFTYGFQG